MKNRKTKIHRRYKKHTGNVRGKRITNIIAGSKKDQAAALHSQHQVAIIKCQQKRDMPRREPQIRAANDNHAYKQTQNLEVSQQNLYAG